MKTTDPARAWRITVGQRSSVRNGPSPGRRSRRPPRRHATLPGNGPRRVRRQVEGLHAHRARRGAVALHRPVPDARLAHAHRARSRPASGSPSRRAPRSSAAATASPTSGSKDCFAWEYKGKRQGPARRLPPAPRVPRGPRQPAAPRRLRPRALRDPHQLHGHRQEGLRASRSTTCATAPAEPLRLLRALFHDPRALRPDGHAPGAHRGGRPAVRDARHRRCGRAGTTRRRWPTSSTGCSSACSPRTPASCRPGVVERLAEATRADPAGFTAQARRAVRAHVDSRRRLVRRRAHRVVQRRPVRRRAGDPAGRCRGRDRAARPPSSTGRRSSRPSSARCSSAASTPTAAASSAPTTPTATSIERLVEPVLHGAAAARVRADAGAGAGAAGAGLRRRTAGARASPRTTRARCSRRSSTGCARVRVLDPACGSRQLPVRRAPVAEGPGARGDPLGLADA